MGQLRLVTLTGADEKTSFEQMAALSERFPFVEWAVLYSPERAGKEPRYPSLEWLENFAEKADEAGMRTALHVCGKAVTLLLESDLERPGLIAGDAKRLFSLCGMFARVQLNTRAKEDLVPRYKALIGVLNRSENHSQVIFAWNKGNKATCDKLLWEHGFEVLVDSSGGRGVSPAEWPDLTYGDFRRVGWAGGLGPDNIAAQLKVLDKHTGERHFWVDMETSLRTHDWFDLNRCEAVLEQAEDFALEQRRSASALWGEGTRDVHTLQELWLDWWVGRAVGVGWALVVPPLNAVRTMQFSRASGEYHGYNPTQSGAHAARLLQQERIALVPSEDDNTWTAYPVGRPRLTTRDEDMLTAGLRAIVLKHFGATVPVDMGEAL